MAVQQGSRAFQPGMPATLELAGQSDSYSTAIEEVRDSTLMIQTPLKQREYMQLRIGTRVMLAVSRRNTPYFYETTVLGAEHSDGKQFTILKRPADTAGIPLRQHVRVPVTINDAQFWVEGDDGKFGPTIRGQILDISAGGMLAMSTEGLPEGRPVLAKFTLSKQSGAMLASLNVLRDYERVSDVGVKRHRSHCQFDNLPERERDRLIKFVFQREGELRRLGVGEYAR